MDDLIELQAATPERELVRERVSELEVPGREGYLGILPGHAPLMSLLGIGVLSYSVGSRRHHMAIQGGFLEVLPDHVRVLANLAECAEDINLEQARSDLATFQRQVDSGEGDEALRNLSLAQARISAAEQK